MNQQRRMFRGRGGPNDRRLPKHNARRRRPHPEDGEEPRPPKYTTPAPTQHLPVNGEHNNDVDNESMSKSSFDQETSDDGDAEESSCQKAKDSQSPPPPKILEEIRHLKRRVRNVQESIQTSVSLVNPSVYQEICLNAVANCVNEWRSIVRHYCSTVSEEQKEEEEDSDNKNFILSIELRTETGLVVFQLIQLSLQTGPLAGGKPGYFKRCGAEVAKMVGVYLDEILPAHQALAESMGFSASQMLVLKKWQDNASKAAMNDKPPSKSVLKKQQQQQQQRAQKKKGNNK